MAGENNPELEMTEEEAINLLILAVGKQATEELLNKIREYEHDNI